MPLRRAGTVPNTKPSWPGLTRPSIFFERFSGKRMDARVKPAHDEVCALYGPGSAKQRFARATRCIAPGARDLLTGTWLGESAIMLRSKRSRLRDLRTFARDPDFHDFRRHLHG